MREGEHRIGQTRRRFQVDGLLTLLDGLLHSTGEVVDPQRFIPAFERERIETVGLLDASDRFIEAAKRREIRGIAQICLGQIRVDLQRPPIFPLCRPTSPSRRAGGRWPA